ncbi:ATP-binding cassette domain-containing protein, partial [Acinetobacter baumannii]
LTDQEKTDNYLFVPESSELQKTEIDVKSLRFRYSEEESWIIHGINFNIPEGQSVAIVGSTGCGKTTLMNLLLGNLNPEHGEIKIGGQSIKSL